MGKSHKHVKVKDDKEATELIKEVYTLINNDELSGDEIDVKIDAIMERLEWYCSGIYNIVLCDLDTEGISPQEMLDRARSRQSKPILL